MSVTLAFLRLLPRNLISRGAGRLAGLRLPGPLQRAVIRGLGRAVGVDFAEVRDPLDRFASLQDFFVRRLRDGVRPIDPAPDAVVAPCDGAWGASGTVAGATLFQVKGRPYSLGALLGGDAEARRFEGGAYATLYLSPRDYHRFHTPCQVRVRRVVYLPGTLWPVNRAGVEGIDAVFAQNERLVAFLDAGGELAIAAVGATMVGKVCLSFEDDLRTNAGGPRSERTYDLELAKGEEWGRFEFGSTLVMVATPGLLELAARAPGTRLRLGERIGTLVKGRSPD